MKNNILNKNINYLELNENIIGKLQKINIETVDDLWKLKRNDLKKANLNDKEINDVIIKLQLNALDLGKKKY